MDGTRAHAVSELRNAAGRALRASCNRIVDGVHERRCPTCKAWFPWTAQYFHRRGKKHLWTHCKDCACEMARARHIPTVRHLLDPRDPPPGPRRRFDAMPLANVMRNAMSPLEEQTPDACALRRLAYLREAVD